MIGWGIYFRVSGDGHGHREFRVRPFGHRELAPGFRRLMAERLIPERLTTVAVTRHLELIVSAAYFPVSGFPLRGCIDAMTTSPSPSPGSGPIWITFPSG